MKTPGHFHGRAFPLTVTGEKVRQIDFGSPGATAIERGPSRVILRSPLSNGVIFADEVGLGKTIEAGIVLSQRWAERRRRILIIVPAMLRKQWQQELEEKFYLPSLVLDTKVANRLQNNGLANPFEQNAHPPQAGYRVRTIHQACANYTGFLAQ